MIVNLSGFKNAEDHRHFMNYMKQALDRHIYEYARAKQGWLTPLSDYWAENKRLIISYTEKSYLDSTTFWPGIMQRWCNCRKFSYLHDYLKSQNEW